MKLAVYFDRLPYEKIKQLRDVIGHGEMAWESIFPNLPINKKLEVGRIAFSREVKNVIIQSERNVSNGFPTPIIIAEEI